MDADELSVTVHRKGAVSQLLVAGDLTAFTCRHLADAVTRAVQEGALTVELDLTDVTFMDSSGVQCLIQARRTADDHHGAVAKVTGMSKQVLRVLQVTGLVESLTRGDTV